MRMGGGGRVIKFWQALGHRIERSLNAYYDDNISEIIIDIEMNIEQHS